MGEISDVSIPDALGIHVRIIFWIGPRTRGNRFALFACSGDKTRSLDQFNQSARIGFAGRIGAVCIAVAFKKNR